MTQHAYQDRSHPHHLPSLLQSWRYTVLLDPVARFGGEAHRPNRMTSHSAASSDEDWSEGDSDESILYEDRSTLRRETQPMGISKGYVPEWEPAEAFREFTQNW